MTKAEVAKLLTYISMENKNCEVTEERVEFWFDVIGHHDFAVAYTAAKTLVVTNPDREPKVGHVAAKIAELLTPADQRPCASIAWEMAMSAVSRSYHEHSGAPIVALPRPIRETVRSIGSWEMLHTTAPEIMRSTFLKFYEQNLAAEQREKALPPKLRAQIALIDDTQTQRLEGKPAEQKRGALTCSR